MMKMIITDAVVSKGFDDTPTVRFYNGDSGLQIANFRIGKRVYDRKEKDNQRWINFSVKGFGDICERIKKMKLKEGSFINLIARYDEESWTDKQTGTQRTAPILILDEIEYCGGGGRKKEQDASSGDSFTAGSSTPGTPGTDQSYSEAPQGQPYPPIPQGSFGYPGAPQGQGSTPPQPAPPMPENFTGFEDFAAPQGPYF